jgi:hypothetical protein
MDKAEHWTNDWGTTRECKFLNTLGSHSALHGMSRAELLCRYGEAMELRVRWDGINPAQVRRYLVVCLADMEQERAA